MTSPQDSNPDTISAPPQPRPTLLQECLAGFKENVIPAIIIQVFMGLLVASYFLSPSIKTLLTEFTDLFTINIWIDLSVEIGISLILSVLVPIIVMGLQKDFGAVAWWKQLLFFTVYITWYTLESHFLYLGLDHLSSTLTDSTFKQALIETFFDQMIYTALYSVWMTALAFRLMDLNFHMKHWWKSLDRSFWTRVVPVILICNWTVWIPGMLLIYLLPLELEVIVDNLMDCFFMLLLIFISKNASQQHQPEKL